MITDELINGLIPAELAAKSVAAEEVARFTRRSIPLTAMLIAAARRDNFKSDYEGWMQWCANRMGVIKADKRCHLDNIGRMLLMIQQTRHQGVFRLLFEMDSEKLLAITRLVKGTAATAEDVAEVISFANRFGYDLQEMSRDRIRLYVKQWLGLTQADGEREFAEAAEKPAQMMLPGFERSIELFRDLTPETARVMVKTADVADKTAYAGMLLVDSYVNYVQQHAGHADRRHSCLIWWIRSTTWKKIMRKAECGRRKKKLRSRFRLSQNRKRMSRRLPHAAMKIRKMRLNICRKTIRIQWSLRKIHCRMRQRIQEQR